MKKLQHILVVDDDYASNYLTRAILEDMDIAESVHTASNGEEAIKFIKQQCHDIQNFCPELILLDVNMPVMNGFEFMEQFNNLKDLKHANTTVVMLTSSNSERDTQKAIEYKVACYLEKPLSEYSLRSVLSYRDFI